MVRNHQREILENIGAEGTGKITIDTRINTKIIEFYENQNFQTKINKCCLNYPPFRV
jgi:hypothetical protein